MELKGTQRQRVDGRWVHDDGWVGGWRDRRTGGKQGPINKKQISKKIKDKQR